MLNIGWVKNNPLPSNENMKYKYRTEKFESYDVVSLALDDKLNKYSDEGWEIFSVSNIVMAADEDDGTPIYSQQFIFRRPKSEK